MARIGEIQPSFHAGELTPRLFGRIDFSSYDSGAEAIENFIVRPEGGLMRRHGTRFLGEVKTSANGTLLVPFIVSTIQAYMLEFGDRYIRFWKNNAPIVVGATPYEISTPYLTSELAALFTTQSADTLYLAHPAHAPMTLVRANDTSWTLAAIPQNKGPFAPMNTDDTLQVYCIPSTSYNPGDSVSIVSSKDIFTPGHAGSFFYMEEIHWADINVTPYFGDFTHNNTPGVNNEYSNAGNVYLCLAAIGDHTSGQVPPTHTIGEAWDAPQDCGSRALYRYLHSRWAVISLDSYTDARHMSGKIQTRLPSGLCPQSFGISGVSAGSSGRIQIQISGGVTGHHYATNDWVIINGVAGVPNANGSFRVVNPTTSTIELDGTTFSGSYTGGGAVKRFATFLWRFSAFSNARGWPATTAIHEQRLCWGNTQAQPFGFWASKSGDYYEYRPFKEEDDDTIAYNIASNQVDPIRWLMSADRIVIGTLSTEMAAYGGGLGDPITPTNTRIVPQSGEGSNATPPVKAGGYILFVNRAGRKLFALAYTSDADQFIARDVLEIAAHLTVGKTIVRMAWAKNPLSVLWIVLSDGSLVSMTYRPDQQLIAFARHPMANAFVEHVAVIPSQSGMNDDPWLIVRRTINGSIKRYIERISAPFEPTTPQDKTMMGYVDCALQYSGAPATVFTGLGHLEGQTVALIGDGVVLSSQTVAGGKVTLPAPVSNLWAGLGYTSRLRTLRPNKGAQDTAQGKTKRIPRLTVRVMNALGGTAGPYDESVMDPVVTDANDNALLTGDLFTGDKDVFLASDYGLDGRIALVQSVPLPMDVLAIMPLLSVSEG